MGRRFLVVAACALVCAGADGSSLTIKSANAKLPDLKFLIS